MKKYIGVVIILSIQVFTIFTMTALELESILGLWVMIYLYLFYRKAFRLEGDSFSGAGGEYDAVKGVIKTHEFNVSNKEAHYSLKHFNTKWIYLSLAIINAIPTYLLIKA